MKFASDFCSGVIVKVTYQYLISQKLKKVVFFMLMLDVSIELD